MYFFPGPTPEEVTQQYLALIGTPTLPAYWGFGFQAGVHLVSMFDKQLYILQISRWGYKNFAEMRDIVEKNIQAGVPVDTVVGDIDYMDRYKDFSIGESWREFPAYVDQLHSRGMRAVLMFDPAIQANYEPFGRAIAAVSFCPSSPFTLVQRKYLQGAKFGLKHSHFQSLYPLVKGTKIMLGVVWPDNHTAFPDFLDLSGNTAKWWIDELMRFHHQVSFNSVGKSISQNILFAIKKYGFEG
ncbi:unnamed protein product [Cylicostephanus goldi]|uniref:Glycoside hydrolase family 31 TIM barrel domain-containing protein n=1 Tax=Cylicostephanus goldi TaxID=71465 RepID=A0A3P6S7N8_CYLGO|nr:unnamed protein product [Cylicostephanus goldi]